VLKKGELDDLVRKILPLVPITIFDYHFDFSTDSVKTFNGTNVPF